MTSTFLPFLAYTFVTVFTPGPNNITSAAMGMAYGYRRTGQYLAGITSGFFCIMLAAGFLTELISREFPRVEGVLRVVGAVYMLYLAWTILRSSLKEGANPPAPTYLRGLLLQLVNPKVMIFGITVFSGFINDMITARWQVIPAAAILSFLSFSSTSLWALFGSGIQRYLHHRPVLLVFNSSMAILLLYSAAAIAGIL